MQLRKPASFITVHYSEVIWEKALQYDRIYDTAWLNRTFTEDMHGSIRCAMRIYCGALKKATVQSLARDTT